MSENTITIVRSSAHFWPTFIAILAIIYIAGCVVFVGIGVMAWLDGERAEARGFVRRALWWPFAATTTLYHIATYEDDEAAR